MDDRPGRLPAQPRARPQLRQVPRADRRHASSRRTPAKADVTFWLSAPAGRRATISVRHPGLDGPHRDATRRSVRDGRGPRRSSPCRSTRRARRSTARPRDHTAGARSAARASSASTSRRSRATRCYVGLSEAVPSCAVNLRFECRHRGRRRRPAQPAARLGGVGRRRAGARASSTPTTTGGLNRAGDVILHVPRAHVASLISNQRAGWLRCRVSRPRRASRLRRLAARSSGSDGVHDRRHGRRPCTPQTVDERDPRHLRGRARAALRAEARARRPGRRPARPPGRGRRGLGGVDARSRTSPTARPTTGTSCSTRSTASVALGPAVRAGRRRRSASTAPSRPRARVLRLAAYRTGGGRQGNVSRGSLRILRTSIPFVDRVENRHPARGGVDARDDRGREGTAARSCCAPATAP